MLIASQFKLEIHPSVLLIHEHLTIPNSEHLAQDLCFLMRVKTLLCLESLDSNSCLNLAALASHLQKTTKAIKTKKQIMKHWLLHWQSI